MKIYTVIHLYDTDGGFGDAIEQEEVIGIFPTREDAEDVVKRFSRDYIYDKPYDYLHCGVLEIREQTLKTAADVKEPWWLPQYIYDDKDRKLFVVYKDGEEDYAIVGRELADRFMEDSEREVKETDEEYPERDY